MIDVYLCLFFCFFGYHIIALAWNVEDWIPPTEKYIFSFNAKQEVKKWHLYSDSEYGGMCMCMFIL